MNANQQPKSANFNFLAKRYPDLERIGALCEHYFTVDPIVALITLRQFGELLAQMVSARSGLLTDAREQQADLLKRLRVEPQKASFASYLIRVRCCGLLPILLSGYINSAYGRDWVASVVNQQVGQANVNGTKLRQLGIPIMPPEEQVEIARRIERAFAWVERLASETNSARKLVDHLDQAILAKAFRGELVPQDPNDEPASELLERIRVERQAAPMPRSRREREKTPKKTIKLKPVGRRRRS
jgi:hypothetical protein